jgi:hypothetical protein
VALPDKIGSLQLFVRGYQDGTTFLRALAAGLSSATAGGGGGGGLPPNLARQFQQQFEAMVILDYIIRNTGTPCIPTEKAYAREEEREADLERERERERERRTKTVKEGERARAFFE